MLPSVLLVLLGSLVAVRSHPTGAPTDACDTLEPQHGVTSQSSPSPYTITVSPATISKGQTATVTIGGKKFRGFIVQARDTTTNNRVDGVFSVVAGTQTINCGKEIANTATHTSNDEKEPISLQWTPPEGYTGTVQFKGAVVETAAQYWSGLSSSQLTVQ